MDTLPRLEDLDTLYETYSELRENVEGFVINFNNSIQKYVRRKDGKFGPHTF